MIAIPLLLSCFFFESFFFSHLSFLETPATLFLASWYPLPSYNPTRFAPQKIITPFRGLRMNAVLIRYTRKVKYKRASGAKRTLLPRLATRMRTQDERRNLDPFSLALRGDPEYPPLLALGVPL